MEILGHLDDVARSYAKRITQSMLIDSVMTEDFKKQLQSKFTEGDTEGAMELIMQGKATMLALAPEIADALEPLRSYIQNSGSNNGSNTLKSGINKELVEGTSSLIASYLNAMRADLSVLRTLQTASWQDVRKVGEVAPSLRDHLTSLDAHAMNIEISNREILEKVSRLAGTVTASTNGGNAIRTAK